MLGGLHVAAFLLLHTGIGIASDGEFPFLCIEEQTSVVTSLRVYACTDAAICSVRNGAGTALGACGDKVEHSAGAFRIILGAGIRYNFNAFDRRCRHHLEYLGRV